MILSNGCFLFKKKFMKSAVILVGGKARRAEGREKYFFSIDGQMFIDRTLSTLNDIVDEILIVGKDPGQGEKFISFPQIRYIFDEIPDRGPLNGLITGARAARGSEIFAVACDMPFINKKVINRLFSFLPGYEAVIPIWENGYIEPLHGVYLRDRLIKEEELMENHSFRDYLDRIKVKNIPVELMNDIDPEFLSFTNVNSMDDYNHLTKPFQNKSP